jgi:primosomal protein N' (replication factor Y)
VSSPLVSVAIPIPHLGLLTYRVPDGYPEPVRGARVVVPLGSRRLTGVVLGAAPEPDPTLALRDLIHTLDAGAFVPPDVVALTAWMADYYLAGPGAALATALPPRALTGRADAFRRVRLATITPEGRDALDRLLNPRCAADGDRPRLGARQREALGLLANRPSGWQGPELAQRGIPWSVVARLAGAGFASLGSERIDRDPFGGHHHLPADAVRVTPEQETALGTLERLAASAAFRVALVHGVTGSGKTEIYLRLAHSVRASGRGALVLVPEIALTPQVAARFRARFGTRVAIQHSGLSDGERHDQWHRIRRWSVRGSSSWTRSTTRRTSRRRRPGITAATWP